MSYTGPERRRYTRVSSGRFVVSYRILDEINNIDVTQTKNLSLGGMSLVANVAWPEGSQVRVLFNSLVLDGVIVYRRDVTAANPECRYGIKFQKLGFKNLLKLRKVLQENYKGPLAVI